MKQGSADGQNRSACFQRYIVPFGFGGNRREGAYEAACAALEASGDWELAALKGEDDIYAYMSQLYRTGAEDGPGKIGSIWEYTRRADGSNHNKSILSACLYDRGMADGEYDMTGFQCVSAGLYLLKNGVGLFWYELVLDDGEFDEGRLLRFQNRIKELAQSNNIGENGKIGRGGVLCRRHFETMFLEKDDVDCEGSPLGALKEKNPDMGSEPYQEVLRGLRERSSAPEDCVRFQCEGQMRWINNIGKYKASVSYGMPMRLGFWVVEVLSALGCGITFYPPRLHKEENGEKTAIPDKAVLYNYFVLPEEPYKNDDRLLDFAYHMTHGYSAKYQAPLIDQKVDLDVFRPFANAVWMVAKEGCGYYIYVNENNQDTFCGEIASRVANAYFFLYMNLLQQSYALLKAAGEIAQEFPADHRHYLKAAKLAETEEREARMYVFLLKNVYASVSHIGHQNEFYAYAERRLRIREDIESLQTGLASLNELQHQKEDEKMNLGLACLSVFAIFSALADGISLIGIAQDWGAGSPGQRAWMAVLFVIVGALAVTAVATLASVLVKTVSRWLRRR